MVTRDLITVINNLFLPDFILLNLIFPPSTLTTILQEPTLYYSDGHNGPIGPDHLRTAVKQSQL